MGFNLFSVLSSAREEANERIADWSNEFAQWRRDVRDDPTLILRTRAIVIALVGLGVVGTALGVQFVGRRWVSNASGEKQWDEKATQLAILYVACSRTECAHVFTTQQAMKFAGWPLECPRCGQKSAYRATVCPKCRQWFAVAPGQTGGCPHCAAKNRPVQKKVIPREGTKPGDDEDGWGALPKAPPGKP